MTDMIRIIKGCLLGITLVASTIAVFFTDTTPYWNDITFIVWCLCIILTIDVIDKKWRNT